MPWQSGKTPPLIPISDPGSPFIRAPLEQLAPNPDHPRDDWENIDEDLQALAQSLESSQITPLICTLVSEDETEYAAGARFRVRDGHRRFRAAQYVGLGELNIVIYAGRDGQPVDGVELACLWAVTGVSVKQPTPLQVLRAIVIIRNEWSRQDTIGGTPSRPLTRRAVAHRLGVSPSTAHRSLVVAEEPRSIVEAVLAEKVQIGAVLALIEHISSREQRTELVADICRRNDERRVEGQEEFSIAEIVELATSSESLGSVLPRESSGHQWTEDRADGLLEPDSSLDEHVSGGSIPQEVASDEEVVSDAALYGPTPRARKNPPSLPPLAIFLLYKRDPEPQAISRAIALAQDLDTVSEELSRVASLRMREPVQRLRGLIQEIATLLEASESI
jgi:ParB-like chromosome segregation protein Spo0J